MRHIAKKDIRINLRIRSKEMRVIGENGEQLGVMSSQDALERAVEAGLDLVEIAPTATPPQNLRLPAALKVWIEEGIKRRPWARNQCKVSLLRVISTSHRSGLVR